MMKLPTNNISSTFGNNNKTTNQPHHKHKNHYTNSKIGPLLRSTNTKNLQLTITLNTMELMWALMAPESTMTGPNVLGTSSTLPPTNHIHGQNSEASWPSKKLPTLHMALQCQTSTFKPSTWPRLDPGTFRHQQNPVISPTHIYILEMPIHTTTLHRPCRSTIPLKPYLHPKLMCQNSCRKRRWLKLRHSTRSQKDYDQCTAESLLLLISTTSRSLFAASYRGWMRISNPYGLQIPMDPCAERIMTSTHASKQPSASNWSSSHQSDGNLPLPMQRATLQQDRMDQAIHSIHNQALPISTIGPGRKICLQKKSRSYWVDTHVSVVVVTTTNLPNALSYPRPTPWYINSPTKTQRQTMPMLPPLHNPPLPPMNPPTILQGVPPLFLIYPSYWKIIQHDTMATTVHWHRHLILMPQLKL